MMMMTDLGNKDKEVMKELDNALINTLRKCYYFHMNSYSCLLGFN